MTKNEIWISKLVMRRGNWQFRKNTAVPTMSNYSSVNYIEVLEGITAKKKQPKKVLENIEKSQMLLKCMDVVE